MTNSKPDELSSTPLSRSHSSSPPPPPYSLDDDNGSKTNDAKHQDETIDEPDINGAIAALSGLRIAPGPRDPDADVCLLHLKLLHAFESLKEDIGYTDGLWGLWNTAAMAATAVSIPTLDKDGHLVEEVKNTTNDDEARQTALSQIREKRWALFVARAVDRYGAWWKAMSDGARRLHVDDQEKSGSEHYEYFVRYGESLPNLTRHELPPLDVLMVWHTHMLNPRAYLQDCMRSGLRRLWWQGMPWDLVNEAIDASSFRYFVPEKVKAVWVAQTGRPWENTDDALTKSLACPMCNVQLTVPWTTCGVEDEVHVKKGAATTMHLGGQGYGDGEPRFSCHGCGCVIDQKLLSVARFRSDARDLVNHGVPMPGTVLRPLTGKPDLWMTVRPLRLAKMPDPLTMPNLVVKHVVHAKLEELLPPSIEEIRSMVEAGLNDRDTFGFFFDNPGQDADKVPTMAAHAARGMMNRYRHGNFSPFTLDLSGAVIRQGIFVTKMYRIDWLHSPAATATAERLCVKYKRFLTMMRFNRDYMHVPTLDVDLAWHTHQLSPSSYYKASTFGGGSGGYFVDHDDKVREDKLGEAFEYTSKTYQEAFNEVYSECTCWYCEAVRASHVSSVGRVFRLSKHEKVADKFHDSGKAKQCLPDYSAHISAHNAVALHEPDEALDSKGRLIFTTQKHAEAAYEVRMNEAYNKACLRAGKKGRKLPPKEDYYEQWGNKYHMYGPWHPTHLTSTMYYAPPNSVPSNHTGAAGGCVAGDCGSPSVAPFTIRGARPSGSNAGASCGGGCAGGCAGGGGSGGGTGSGVALAGGGGGGGCGGGGGS